MGKVALIAKDAVTMGLKMPASLCLVFLVDLVFLGICDLLIVHLLTLIHIIHHVELVWLNKSHLLVELTTVWLLHHIILLRRIVSHLILHHVHLTWELTLRLLPRLVLHHLVLHWLLGNHSVEVHVGHLLGGTVSHHHIVLLHVLLIALHI